MFTPSKKKVGTPRRLAYGWIVEKPPSRKPEALPMATVSHSLFSWQAVESSDDIFRFQRLLEGLDDRRLIAHLVADRKGRRDDNPIPAMWNSLLAGLVFGHAGPASLRRELRRNGELRQVCGFDPVKKEKAVPSADAYGRFLEKLAEHADLVMEVFEDLVARLAELLGDFGEHLAADGKAITACRRDDADAAVGKKKQGHPDGEGAAEVTYQWFGYKLHMLCDATYELPIAFEVTNAAEHESPRLLDLVEHVAERHEPLLERTQTLCADMGYDDGEDKALLYDDYGVAPIIPARDLKEGRYEPLDEQRHDSIYLSATGQVCCKIRPFATTDEQRFVPMQFTGFEKDRQTLKFRCPAAVYGLECENREACRCRSQVRDGDWGRVVRVPIEKNRRLFGPVYAHSYHFEDLYKSRTSVERLFFRVDHMYGFEHHTTRGLARMKTRVTMALIAMLATAVGWIEAGQPENARRMLQAA